MNHVKHPAQHIGLMRHCASLRPDLQNLIDVDAEDLNFVLRFVVRGHLHECLEEEEIKLASRWDDGEEETNRCLLDDGHDVHAAVHASKHSVLAVEPRSFYCCDEELRTIGSRPKDIQANW